LEQYVKRIAQLGSLDSLPTELIAEEYRVRHRFGDRPSHAEYAARFPRHGRTVLNELSRVDADLRNEYADAPGANRRHGMTHGQSHHVGAGAALDYRDYAIRRLLGRGGMNRVYTAVQKSSGEAVALKVMNKELLRSERACLRFLREAKIGSQFSDPGLVNTHGVGRFPDGGYFMAMQLVDGSDLAHRPAQVQMSMDDAVASVEKIARLVEVLHRCGYLHCDLKPSNVLIDSRGQAWLTDFAMAQPIDHIRRRASDAIAMGGTYAFMAPEQFDGDAAGLSAATDVFGLGGILFFLLTGKSPRSVDRFDSSTGDLPEIETTALRDSPDAIRQLVLRCVAPEPQQRIQSATELARQLSDCRWQTLL
jgi:serine/threonine protein kinase